MLFGMISFFEYKGSNKEGWIKQSWRADAQLMHMTHMGHEFEAGLCHVSILFLIISIIFPFLSNKSTKKPMDY